MGQLIKPYRVGILGGMGPLAGVELHRLIVESTPAQVDQDHLQIVLYTNPHIPDRTISLRQDNGVRYADVVASSIVELEEMSVDIIAIACMTAHTRLDLIRQKVTTPILDGVELTQNYLRAGYNGKGIALLATNGSIESALYTQDACDIDWSIPSGSMQRKVMEAIYDIKGGFIKQGVQKIRAIMSLLLVTQQVEIFVLGCTELGLLHSSLLQDGFTMVDPLRVIAKAIVERGHSRTLTVLK